MSVVEHPQERARIEGERSTVALMGTINVATARLVATVAMMLATGGWEGYGINSPEHWLRWKAAMDDRRARGLVRIARRVDDLPVCWSMFQEGRLSEDAMVCIARRVPAERDEEVAGWAAGMLISQLKRVLASCPEVLLPDEDKAPKQRPERYVRMSDRDDGGGTGQFQLPPDEMALLRNGLCAGRDAEFRDRRGLEPDADLTDIAPGATRPGVDWADALVRMASEACDALDNTLQRTGYRGERHQIVLHHDVDAHGHFGPGQLHLGPVVPDPIARYLGCDAQVVVMAYQAGQLLGITPTDRTPSRKVRRYLERRDQGCTHPLCSQRRWLQAHHIEHWEDGGPTEPHNLVMLCWLHHKELHQGAFTIVGDPEDGTLRFLDARGSPIEPPGMGPTRLPRPAEPSPFIPPYGERLEARWFDWN